MVSGSAAIGLKKIDEQIDQLKTERAIYRNAGLTICHSLFFLPALVRINVPFQFSQRLIKTPISPETQPGRPAAVRLRSDAGKEIKLKHNAAVKSCIPLKPSLPCDNISRGVADCSFRLPRDNRGICVRYVRVCRYIVVAII